MSARVAVAVVSWNTRDLLARCLESLGPAAEAGTAEVWVVDNGSSDGSPALVRKRFGWAELVEPGANLGFGAAVNLVAERTRSPWLAAVNADVELRPGALDALLEAGDADPGAGALAPRLRRPDGGVEHSVHRFPTLPFLIAFNLGLHRLSRRLASAMCIEGVLDLDRPRAVPWAFGAFLLFRREAFDAVGGFDTGQWLYAEDIDVAWRLHRAGWDVRYEPAAEALHAGGAATSQAFGADRRERFMAATYAWLRERRGGSRARAAAAVNLMGALARAALLTPPALVRPGRFRAPRDDALAWARAHRVGLRGRDRLRAATAAPANGG